MNGFRRKANKWVRFSFDTFKDTGINYLLHKFNIPYTTQIYCLIATSPIDIIVSMLAVKFGLNEVAVLIIMAFLL